MANTKRYSVEFKEEAVKRALESGYSISEVAKQLGMSTTTQQQWVKKIGENRRKVVGYPPDILDTGE